MKKKPILYLSFDIEADGPVPGKNSMLSIGCVAFNEEGTEVSNFYANLKTLSCATPDPTTMEWWASNEAAYLDTRVDQKEPDEVIEKLISWMDSLASYRLVFVGYPACYDFMFVYWYLMVHAPEGYKSPFGFQGLDLKTLAMAKLGTRFDETAKKKMPKSWTAGLPKHTHNALDDAREQGILLFRILNHEKEAEAQVGETTA